MLALVQSSGLGSVRSASRRGRPCVAHVGKLRYQHVTSAAAHQNGVCVGEKEPPRSLASHGYHMITSKELFGNYPEVHEAVKEFAKYRLDTPVSVYHKEDPSRHAKVLRREFLAASTSLPAAENFLKQQLGIDAQQKIKVSYSLAPAIAEAEECEVNDKELPMAYWVGYANSWFVSNVKQDIVACC